MANYDSFAAFAAGGHASFARDRGAYWNPDASAIWPTFAANEPRVLAGRGLFLEAAATNHLPNNADLSTWISNMTTLAAQGGDIWRMNNDGQNAGMRIAVLNVAPVDQTCVRSVLVKSAGITAVNLQSFQTFPGGEPWQRVEFTFATKSLVPIGGAGAPTAYGFDELADDWFRIWFRQSVNSANLMYRNQFVVRCISAATDPLNSGLLVRWPQLEIGDAPSTPIRTTGSAATRPADQLTLHLPFECDLGVTFDDDSVQHIPGVDGDHLLQRSNLNRAVVKSITAVMA